MPKLYSLELRVFAPASIYDDYADEVIAYTISTDPAHESPYLLIPNQYATQEIDPIQCTASIGSIEVGAIDVPTIPGDQTTGWMTARVSDLRGRRCQLVRWMGTEYITIADGPAGPAKMDPSYAAYRWTIKDTRELERQLQAFTSGGTASIVPRGIIPGFGAYQSDDGPAQVIAPVVPLTGHYIPASFDDGFGHIIGAVEFNNEFSGDIAPVEILTDRLIISDEGLALLQPSQLGPNTWACVTADVLWRIPGDTIWNVARAAFPASVRFGIGNIEQALFGPDPENQDLVNVLQQVYLYFDTVIPDGFPTEECDLEIVVRSRAAASDDFPYYLEGILGDVLTDLYTSKLTRAPDYGGLVYDPAGLDASQSLKIDAIRFDPAPLACMTEQVLMRVADVADNVRDWADTNLYGPSGWIAAFDNTLQISPIKRDRPTSVDEASTAADSVVVPSPTWQEGNTTVSGVTYTYPRFFAPDPGSNIAVDPVGLAQRDVIIEFTDPSSELRYDENIEAYDASAFGAVGQPNGDSLPGRLEQASLFAQIAKFEVLDRYRSGAPSITVLALRTVFPDVRVGAWLRWDLSWIPNDKTGLRGDVSIAQVLSIRDDDSVWRAFLLEGVSDLGANPGDVTSLIKLVDELEPGDATSLVLISDEATY
jgi:hypothetical protein